ncbi:LOW QUALITY PROTEIN: hypothetical protein Q4I32_000411 [Leishmania shawi]|uniref:Secreted protein n=1 Tax=Leishmania shawi TaxID=5680 RepID=A0AAW3CB58_9TRYP
MRSMSFGIAAVLARCGITAIGRRRDHRCLSRVYSTAGLLFSIPLSLSPWTGRDPRGIAGGLTYAPPSPSPPFPSTRLITIVPH